MSFALLGVCNLATRQGHSFIVKLFGAEGMICIPLLLALLCSLEYEVVMHTYAVPYFVLPMIISIARAGFAVLDLSADSPGRIEGSIQDLWNHRVRDGTLVWPCLPATSSALVLWYVAVLWYARLTDSQVVQNMFRCSFAWLISANASLAGVAFIALRTTRHRALFFPSRAQSGAPSSLPIILGMVRERKRVKHKLVELTRRRFVAVSLMQDVVPLNVALGKGNQLMLALAQPREMLCSPCSICLSEYEMGEEVLELHCGHDFHAACLSRWLCHAMHSVHKCGCPMRCRDPPGNSFVGRFSFPGQVANIVIPTLP